MFAILARSAASKVGGCISRASKETALRNSSWRPTSRSVASIPPGAPKVDPEILSKARKMSPPVGFAAGIFGALVGVGGGVVIVPTIVSACKNIPQR